MTVFEPAIIYPVVAALHVLGLHQLMTFAENIVGIPSAVRVVIGGYRCLVYK